LRFEAKSVDDDYKHSKKRKTKRCLLSSESSRRGGIDEAHRARKEKREKKTQRCSILSDHRCSSTEELLAMSSQTSFSFFFPVSG